MIGHVESLPVGWIVFVVVMVALAAPTIVSYAKFELRLARRVRRRERIADARGVRVFW